MPVPRQMASVSPSRIARSPGGTFASVCTLTAIGGMDLTASPSAAPAIVVTIVTATLAAAAISILSAIDGARRRKFDVRKRQRRTVLNLKIARHDVFRNPNTELCDGNVARVLRVGLERCRSRKVTERPV